MEEKKFLGFRKHLTQHFKHYGKIVTYAWKLININLIKRIVVLIFVLLNRR